MTSLEYIKRMSRMLTPEQRKELQVFLEQPSSSVKIGKPVSLRGSWKGIWPEEVDTDALIREIRDEWKEDFELNS